MAEGEGQTQLPNQGQNHGQQQDEPARDADKPWRDVDPQLDYFKKDDKPETLEK